MKVIAALKRTKILAAQIEQLQKSIALHSAKKSFEKSPYEDPVAKVASMLQAAHDLNLELEQLTHRIHKTNVLSKLTISLNGNNVTKTIDEWIYRRRLGAPRDSATWNRLTDRGLKDEQVKQSDGTILLVTVDRHFSVEARDKKLAELAAEPIEIDTALEIWNAVSDLVD